jgi:hypothetical protein
MLEQRRGWPCRYPLALLTSPDLPIAGLGPDPLCLYTGRAGRTQPPDRRPRNPNG